MKSFKEYLKEETKSVASNINFIKDTTDSSLNKYKNQIGIIAGWTGSKPGQYRSVILPDKHDLSSYPTGQYEMLARLSNIGTKTSKDGNTENTTIIKINFLTGKIVFPKNPELDNGKWDRPLTFKYFNIKVKEYIKQIKSMNLV